MAHKATSEGVRADMAPPNFRAAVQQIRTTKAKKDRVSGINGEIAGVYAKVEGFKVNKKAGKFFYALDNMEPEERNDVLRSVDGLIAASGWDADDQDLVDKAEGTVVPLRFGGAASKGDDGDADLDEALADEASRDLGDDVDEALRSDDFEEASDEELAAQAGRGKDKAKDRARAKLDQDPPPGTGAAAMKAMKEAGQVVPFTGDNSDLAGAKPQGSA